MSARSRPVSLGAFVAALACAGMLSIAAPTAGAAEQWNNGTPAMSTQVKCVIDLQETGAIAEAGYLSDPAQPPKAGQVFYGHADFSATTDTACSSGDQVAQLDVVLPRGVSLAVDAAHPITCLYADNGGAQLTYPTCPTSTIVGAYGPEIPSDNAGHAWTMPAGREFDIRFPLTSDRRLAGPAGGHCPQSVDEIPTNPQRDCLLIALNVADGYSNPWLTPSVEMFIDPAAPGPGPKPPPPPPPSPPPPRAPTISQIAFTSAHLASAGTRGLRLSMHCAAACSGRVNVALPASTAKRLHLATGAITLTSGRFSAAAGHQATVKLKLSRRLARKVRKLKSLPVIVTVTPAGGARAVVHLTLHR